MNANGRLLRPDEVPTLGLPGPVRPKEIRKPPKDRSSLPKGVVRSVTRRDLSEERVHHDGVQTDKVVTDEERDLLKKVSSLQSLINLKEQQLSQQKFRLANIKDDDCQVSFYTGFQSYKALEAFYTFLGPAAECLCYSNVVVSSKKKRRNRSLPPMEELFLTLIRLRLGLMEQDIAYRFNLSQPTMSRIITTWVNYMYLELKKIPLWPSKEVIQSNLPMAFKKQYPERELL